MCDGLQMGTTGTGDAGQIDYPKALAFNQLSQSSVYKQTEQTVALTVCGGTHGGGAANV